MHIQMGLSGCTAAGRRTTMSITNDHVYIYVDRHSEERHSICGEFQGHGNVYVPFREPDRARGQSLLLPNLAELNLINELRD